MRLEYHHQISVRPTCSRGFNRCIHFSRVVTVVIHQHRRARFAVYRFQREFAEEIEAPSCTLETLQRA
ncbi:hypothetical protein D3C77_746130 [compost metagenome]